MKTSVLLPPGNVLGWIQAGSVALLSSSPRLGLILEFFAVSWVIFSARICSSSESRASLQMPLSLPKGKSCWARHKNHQENPQPHQDFPNFEKLEKLGVILLFFTIPSPLFHRDSWPGRSSGVFSFCPAKFCRVGVTQLLLGILELKLEKPSKTQIQALTQSPLNPVPKGHIHRFLGHFQGW